ncbi:MAG: hypothetical protein K2N63_13455, partial [Lachnospiraceae bacterium]|nr:hypothetical protein [Lachnospiraceae bacterium]
PRTPDTTPNVRGSEGDQTLSVCGGRGEGFCGTYISRIPDTSRKRFGSYADETLSRWGEGGGILRDL